MKFKYTTDEDFQGMLQERLRQLELRYKESQDICKLLKMQEPPPPNLEELVEKQEEIQHQLDQNYANVEELLKKERKEDTPNRAARRTVKKPSNGKGPVDINKLKPSLSAVE